MSDLYPRIVSPLGRLLVCTALCLVGPQSAALAAEAAVPRDAAASHERRLREAGFTPEGAPRQKGQLLVVTAWKDGAPWRIVIDRATGEVIGRRPLVELIRNHERP